MNEKRSVNVAGVGVQYGILAGIGCIVLTLILYMINMGLIVSYWFLSVYAVIVIAMIYSAYVIRRAQHNYIVFKDALKATFLVAIFAMLIWTVFNVILFKYIDPDLIQLLKEHSIEQLEKALKLAETPPGRVQEEIRRAESRNYAPTLATTALSYALSLIFGFIYAAVISGIFHLVSKDNAPRESEAQPS